MHVFMVKWYEKFPDFKSRALFLTGESYAGLINSNQSFILLPDYFFETPIVEYFKSFF